MSSSWPTIIASHLLTKRLHPRGRRAHVVVDRLNANIRIADCRLRPLLIRQRPRLKGRRSIFGCVEIGVGATRLDGGTLSCCQRILNVLLHWFVSGLCCAQTPRGCLCLSKQIRSCEPDAALSWALQVGKVLKKLRSRVARVRCLSSVSAPKVGMLFETEMRDNPRLKTVTSRVLNPVFVPEEKEIPQESRDARAFRGRLRCNR